MPTVRSSPSRWNNDATTRTLRMRRSNQVVRREELTSATCRQLLAEHTVGRVGFHSAGGSVIIPVNYQMVNDAVVFRTSPAGVLAQLRRRTSVAFEVDDID